MALVKICGNMTEEHVQICLDYHTDIIGFVTDYPIPVPWNISLEQAVELKKYAAGRALTSAVVGGSADKIISIALRLQPDFLQLHLDETLDDIKTIKQELAPLPIKIVKALRVEQNKKCHFQIPDFSDAVLSLQASGIDALLIDASVKNLPGGTGLTLDPTIYLEAKELLSIPLIIAGGITDRNAAALIRSVNPYAIDVLTGAEDSHGIKSPSKIHALMKAVKSIL